MAESLQAREKCVRRGLASLAACQHGDHVLRPACRMSSSTVFQAWLTPVALFPSQPINHVNWNWPSQLKCLLVWCFLAAAWNGCQHWKVLCVLTCETVHHVFGSICVRAEHNHGVCAWQGLGFVTVLRAT